MAEADSITTLDTETASTLDIDLLSELNTRFSALGLALEGLCEHAKYCQVERPQVEAIALLFHDLKGEYRDVLREAGGV